MPQICTIYKIVKDESKFNQIERNKEVRPTKSSKECNSKNQKKKGRLWSQYNISTFVDQGRWQQNYRSVEGR